MVEEFVNAEYQLEDGTVHRGFVALVRYLVNQAVEKEIDKKLEEHNDVIFAKLNKDELAKEICDAGEIKMVEEKE